MRSPVTALVYGLLLWAVVFAVALFLFPVRLAERPLFESIMPVALTAGTVTGAVLYFRRVQRSFLREGVLLGVIWLVLQILPDALMFSRGPMQMSLADYVKDIGVAYLIIPCVTVGAGLCLHRFEPSSPA